MTAKRNAQETLDFILTPGLSSLERLQRLQPLRVDPEMSQAADAVMLERIAHQQQALVRAESNLRQAQAVLEKLSAPPWSPACFLRLVQLGKNRRALVRDGNVTRLVEIAPDVDPDSLSLCDEVFLNQAQGTLLGRLPVVGPSWRSGEACLVKCVLPDGRLLVSNKGEDLLVHAPRALCESVKEGEQALCDLTTRVALERVPRQETSHLFLENTPRDSFADVGGLDGQIRRIKNTVLLHWKSPQVAKRYRLPRASSILLCGPPGTGKTLVARAFANFIATLSPSSQSLFINVKPGELHSMWYSESERNYRELFRIARQKGTAERPCIIFLDEIDSVGVSRGQSHMRVHDNVLTALISELDGLHERGHVLVVAATNRREALDPALSRPGRLGDIILEVPRPNRPAARSIFEKHLEPDIPFARNGHGEDMTATRAELIEACLAHIYAPNADELATIVFRDGSRRSVRPPDLASGAVIANICRNAKDKAGQREVEQGSAGGMTSADLLLAASEEFAASAKGITVGNCRQHLDLPQDLDVVKVEPAAPKVQHPLRFLQAA
jgi:proteasome-associated ATPase